MKHKGLPQKHKHLQQPFLGRCNKAELSSTFPVWLKAPFSLPG